MRHYVPRKNNPDWLPHNLYMQMLYLIRDYEYGDTGSSTEERKRQLAAVHHAAAEMQELYKKRPNVFGVLNPLRAFFDFPYFSAMFTCGSSDVSASKRLWNLYRCRFARRTAAALKLY